MKESAEILTLFESRMRALKMTQVDLSLRAFGKEDNSAIQSLKRGASPGFDRVAAMAEALGLELYLGMPRATPTGFSDDAVPTDLQTTVASRGGYRQIPWLNPDRLKGSSPVAFAQDWIDSNAFFIERMYAVLPDEIHVADTLATRALAVIDTGKSRTNSFGLWCYRERGLTLISSLSFDRGNIIISSITPGNPPRLILKGDTSSIVVLGKVIWISYLPREHLSSPSRP